jgi:uncharacterized cupredoxin-like copper-binding protein
MRKALLCAAALVLVAATSCASGKGIPTTLDEFTIKPARSLAPAGPESFLARNAGTVAHQLLVLRTDRRPNDLPVKDGVVRTGAKGIDVAGELELVAPGAAQTLEVTLVPGKYVLICNIAGHYASGMHAGFRAT